MNDSNYHWHPVIMARTNFSQKNIQYWNALPPAVVLALSEEAFNFKAFDDKPELNSISLGFGSV